MAKGDFDGAEVGAMALQHAQRSGPGTDFARAKDALRILPQLTSADLQFCIAFGLSPFEFLAAKLTGAAEIAAERQGRIQSEEFAQREERQRQSWSGLTREQLDTMRGAGQR